MTQEQLFIIYYICMAVATLTGLIRYRVLDSAMKTFVAMLCLSCASELMSYYCYKRQLFETRNAIYHAISAVEIICYTIYFQRLGKQQWQNILIRVVIVLAPLICILNSYYFEPLKEVNTNILLLQSFFVITMSLYSIYSMLRADAAYNIFGNPHFWICMLWLISWSCTFFFWAFLKVLYTSHWAHMELVLRLQMMMLVGIYTGMAAVLIFYKTNTKNLGYI